MCAFLFYDTPYTMRHFSLYKSLYSGKTPPVFPSQLSHFQVVLLGLGSCCLDVDQLRGLRVFLYSPGGNTTHTQRLACHLVEDLVTCQAPDLPGRADGVGRVELQPSGQTSGEDFV